jgi:SAM-dependent methyltransferase
MTIMDARDTTLADLRDLTLGPLRFANLLSCFELGIVDLLRGGTTGLTSEEIARETGATPDAVDQLMLLMIKEGLVSHDRAAGTYTAAGLAVLDDDDCARIAMLLTMIKEVCLRQLYYLTDSVREGKVVGLRELYGFDGHLYEATARHPRLRESWSGVMDLVTGLLDPWFLEHVEVPPGARVLDVAGNTGLGAVLAYRHKQAQDPRVTCFDLPEKEAEAVRNFRAHDVAHRCSFVGGNVFDGLPTGFDVALVKNFLEMFDRHAAQAVLRRVHEALNPGGRFHLLAPVHPEDPRESSSADFFPGYFLGCTMGQGGPQRMSTYEEWARAAGFRVVRSLTRDTASLTPDGFFAYGILCGEKAG